MNYKILELEFVRLESVLNKLRGNLFPDNRLNNYLVKLHELTGKVKQQIIDPSFSSKPIHELQTTKNVLTFIKQSIEFLEDSTLNLIPFETVFCLEKALKNWTNRDVIIVTSLQYNTYFFNGFLTFYDLIYTYLQSTYNITFDHRLIQISIPKYEVNNYLLNVVLYHELGHFIDAEYNISDKISKTEAAQNIITISEIEKRRSHLAEYFADLFAAQYIKECSSYYLNYVAYNAPESSTHPATSNRIKIVKDFIEGNTTNNDLNTILSDTKKAILGKELEIRYEELSCVDFNNFIPFDVKNEKQLHGIFILGWDIWLNHRGDTDLSKLNKRVNNLMEKSISNYMIVTNWNNAHVSA